MGKVRSLLVVGIAGAAVLAGAGPAAAAASQPLEVTSTGLAEGQVVGPQLRIRPTWTEGADITAIEVHAGDATSTFKTWPQGVLVPLRPAWNDTDVLVTVRVFAADGATAEASTTVHADTVYPEATFTPTGRPVHGVVTVTADPYSDDVASMTLADNVYSTPIATVTAAPWTFQWDTTQGPRGVGVYVYDRAGNRRWYDLHLRSDNTPPVISEVGFDYGGARGRVHGNAAMRVKLSDDLGVNHTRWVIDGVVVSEYQSGPNTQIGGDLCHYDFGDTPRTVPVEMHAWDQAGNEAVRSFRVTVDSAGPGVAVLYPPSGALVRGSTISSTVLASDPAGISFGSLNNLGYLDPTGGMTVHGVIEAGRDGPKTLAWEVLDNVGNHTTVTRRVTLDNTRPTLSISAPKNGAKVLGTVKITATAGDRNGINRIELLVNGKVVATAGAASHRFTLNTRNYGTTFKISARTYDRAGNATSVSTRTWHR